MTRRIKNALVLFALAVLSDTAHAQAPKYAFTRIADTNVDPDVSSVGCVGLNDLGTVAMTFNNGSVKELWRGDGVTFTKVTEKIGGLCFSINDLDEFAYLTSAFPPATLVRNSAGVLTTLAASNVWPYLDGSSKLYLPSLNNGGSAVFPAVGGPVPPGKDAGIYIAPGPIKVYNATTDAPLNWGDSASLNDSSIAVFRAVGQNGKAGIYRGSDTPLIEDGAIVDGAPLTVSTGRPVINNAGMTAFIGLIGGSARVFTTVDGLTVNTIGTSPLDRIAINDAGVVAFRRNGNGGVIYAGRPGFTNKKVLEFGEALDGSTFQGGFLWEEAINNNGQIAFFAQLADGRRGVYRADPQWLNKLTFAQQVPGCGPITGKITLFGPAPPGGLVVELEDTNSASSVPATVTVPAGKTAATFTITTSPVTGNTVGDITATVGVQSVSRTLTVRPISVKSLTLAPNPVPGGTDVTGTVKLECAAAPGNISVALSSSKPNVANPDVSNVVFLQGTATETFNISTNSVPAPTVAKITASSAGIAKTKKLTVNP